ncbi:MAG: serine/threonine-protein kinase [Nannocystaceae bacterium]
MPTRIAEPVQLNPETPLPSADVEFREHLLDGGGRIDRYVILRHLGEGGMSTVFAAYDEELDRRVALKLLRARASEGALGRTRLLREAQALAKLAHPNVVTVFDVGEFRGQVFVAMELISGQTLRHWFKERRRTWVEIVEVFLQAGRGLAAAHSAGLIHRDVKPSNVVVGDDGRVRVVDFGLALARVSAGEAPGEPGLDATESAARLSSSTLLTTNLTTDGAVAGTPAYMAPEQIIGAASDARSDQFAFGVSLFEALVGVRPHPGRTLDERKEALVSAAEASFPRSAKIPAWLRRVVLRALSIDPERRFPDMDALLAALGRDRERSRRRQLLGLTLGVSFGLGVTVLAREELREAQICRGGDRTIEALWGEARKGSIHAAMQAAHLPYVDASWERLTPILGEYAEGWARLHHDTCEARRRGELTDHLHDLAVACLDRRKAAFAALLDALESPDAATLESAIEAGRRLPELASCADAAALTATTAAGAPELVREIEGLRARLEFARVALHTHHADEGLQIVTTVSTIADALGHDPTRAEALALRGLLLADAGRYEAAAEALTRALWLADIVRDDPLLASVMAQLVYLTGERLGRYDEAMAWRPHAEAVIARIGRRSAAHARLLWAFGATLYRKNASYEAIGTLEEALEIERALFGERGSRVAETMVHLGNAHYVANDFINAQVYYERALTLLEAELGRDHPELASVLDNLGAAVASQGDLDHALDLFRRSLAIGEQIHGPQHPELAPAIGNIGVILAAKGQRTAARAHFRRGLALEEQGGGPDHPSIADSLIRLAALDRDDGDLAGARERLDRASEIAYAVNGAGDPLYLWAQSELGELDLREGAAEEAKIRLQQALDRRLAGPPIGEPEITPMLQYRLARALRALGHDRGRAAELAAAARAGLMAIAGSGDYGAAIAELDAWCMPPNTCL